MLTVVLILLLGVAGLAAALALYTTAQIDRVAVDGLSSSRGQLNVLITGSDSREDLTPEQRAELRTGSDEGVRTDTIILLSVSGQRAAMLSIPRDLYVTRCDGTEGRINAAYAIDGPGCLVQSVSDATGIPIDRYMEVDFSGFVDIVGALGGVTMQIDEPIEDPLAGPPVPAGCQRLDGGQALAFVRTRAGPTGDLGRVERQQRFVKELAREVVAPSTLVNVPRLFATAGAGGSALTADRGLGLIDLGRLGLAFRGLAGGGAQTQVVPSVPDTVGGASVLRVDAAAAEPVFASFRDGSVLQRDEPLSPGDVEVAVRNGAQISGLAGETADGLRASGFGISEVGNTEPVERTVVQHTAGNADAAELVADALPVDPPTEEVGDGPAVVVVLGPDIAEREGAEPVEDEPGPDEAPEAADEPEPDEAPETEDAPRC